MSKFKAGDKVRVINGDEDDYFRNGDIGVIGYTETECCRVNFNGQNNKHVIDGSNRRNARPPVRG